MDGKKREWSLEEHKGHSPQLKKTIEHQDKQHKKSIWIAKINIWLAIGLCILGIIATFFITKWGVYHGLDIQEQKDLEQMKLLEPNISVELSEISENQLKIIVSSMDENRSGINDFFFEFELPGKFLNMTEKRAWRVKNCFITPTKLGKRIRYDETSPMIPIVQRVYVECDSINPYGYYVVEIDYSPTKQIYWNISKPRMDLRDYQEYIYSWIFNGKTQERRGCVNLTDLNYIKKDNENMISEYGFFQNMSSLTDYEEHIRNKIC